MDTNLQTQYSTPWEEANRLIHALRLWGVNYLVGDDTADNSADIEMQALSAVEFIKRLARCDYPRVRDASIALFLFHPELATSVVDALLTSEPDVSERIATLILATLYLQRLWSLQLMLAFGRLSSFPEEPFASLWESRHLPPPAYHNGKWGLQALQLAEQQRSGIALNYLGDWQNQVDHLLLQEGTHHETNPITSVTLFENLQKNDHEAKHEATQEVKMSMRPSVDKRQIEDFLKNLGRAYRKPGRLYLVGGAALVHAGLRVGSTEDIDLDIRATNEDEMTDAIRQLKDTMKINVEFASPADFIPVPSQWEMNASYVGRYGSIDAFYFDFYSIALSKIQRGSTRDINDVKLLLQHKFINLEGLDAAFQEVLPQVGKRPYIRLDPKQFAARYDAVRQLL